MKTTKKDECSYSVSNAIRTLAMIRIIGTVQLCNTFFYTCRYYNRNSKMYRGGVLCVKKKINMISGRLGLP